MVVKPSKHFQGQIFSVGKTGLTIIKDAAMTCMGTLGQPDSQGNWDKTKRMLHISCLDMEAVFLALKHFSIKIRTKQF